MAVLASRLLAPPSLARSQRELASDAQSVSRKGSSPRTLSRSVAKGARLGRSVARPLSGSIMLYLVVDAQGVLNVQPDRTRLELDGETRELVRVFCAEDIVRRRTHDV